MTKEERLKLVNQYKYHNNETGFNEWEKDTPDYVKDIEKEMSKEMELFMSKVKGSSLFAL